ncbi:MAG: hypothetical protein IJL87_05180 [Clostridia bacterium]|nr:hypothetical protein [Clostridia bacterium]
MNIIFGIFVIAAALYIRFESKPKSADAKIIFALLLVSGIVTLFSSLEFTTLAKIILSLVSIGSQTVMLAGYYAQSIVENRTAKKSPARRKRRVCKLGREKRAENLAGNAA